MAVGVEMNKDNPTRQPPDLDISVVFATCNRQAQLARTLDAYRRLDTRGIAWELVVVDNDSHDDTATILARTNDLPMVTLFALEPGQNNARNKALELLRGSLVIFTDDDAIPEPDYLQAYLAAARRWPREAIFGARIEPRFPNNTPAWMRSPDFGFATTAFARYAPAETESIVSRHPYGPSFAVRRDALGEHRFPTHLGPRSGAYAMGGEGHLLRRLKREGWHYVHVPSARVEHVIRPDQITTEWLIQRANKKGRGQVYLPSSRRERRLFWRGISLHRWMAAARAALRFYCLGPFVSECRRTRYGITYELRRGEIQERLAQRQAARCLTGAVHGDDSSGAVASHSPTRHESSHRQ